MNYTVYTDGSCSGNPGPGGCSFVIVPENNMVLTYSKPFIHTTNNRMELTAIVEALRHIQSQISYDNKKKIKIDIYTDSSYCYNPIKQGWIKVWKFNNWNSSSGEILKNVDLWKALYSSLEDEKLEIEFHKVKGHSGDKYNEHADKLAKSAMLKAKRRNNESKINK